MKLKKIFDSAFLQVDHLIRLHDELVTISDRAVRPEWRERFFEAKLSKKWREEDGLWRSRGRNLLIAGKDAAQLNHNSFSAENMAIFLRMALVLAMAAVEKILHQAISNNFTMLLRDEYFDRAVEMKVSTSCKIAIEARARKGKGGKKKARPGHKVKDAVMESIYRGSFQSCRSLEDLCPALGLSKVFSKFGDSLTTKLKYEAVRARWQRIYDKRNAIAHEVDIVRMKKPRTVKFNEVHPTQYKADIDCIRKFGEFLATELE